jgi:hypothetical protein
VNASRSLRPPSARHEAAKHIPERGLHETHEAYLRRVIEHADAHDLPLVKSRAEKLLAKPADRHRQGLLPARLR